MNKVSTYLDNWTKSEDVKCFQFREPTKENLINLKVNDSVKIGNGKENFWVTVQKIEENAVYGKVDNHLVLKKNYNFSDNVVFGKQHILDILNIKEKFSMKYITGEEDI